MIGNVLGNYTITRELGRGGMGAVYLGEHTLIGKRVAIKLLLPELSHDQQLVGRLFNEAKVTTAIQHPGIVEVLDFGFYEDGRAFLVMEFLDGESMRDLLREHGRFDLSLALDYTVQVCEALEAAHDRGVIHRDLKPDNLIILDDGTLPGRQRVKVLDFGIAKLANDDSDGSYRTRTGAVLGTPAYMSPEQCRGAGEVDSRADLYSLGCIMFHMLVGRAPFVGRGSGEVLAAHIYEEPTSMREYVPAIDASIDHLVLSLLDKDADRRPQTARDIIGAIELARQGTDRWLATDVGRSKSTPFAVIPVRLGPPRDGDLRANARANRTSVRHEPGERTTLSAAASTTSARAAESRSRSRSRTLWIAAGACTALALAAGSAILLSGGSAGNSSVGRDAAPSTMAIAELAEKPIDAGPAVFDAMSIESPQDAAAPQMVQVKIDSKPAGATVFVHFDGQAYYGSKGRLLGKTPVSLELPRFDGEFAFRLDRRRYHEKELMISGRVNTSPVVELERVRKGQRKVRAKPAVDTKAGDAKAGDAKAGDAKAGDAKASDTKAGDTKAGPPIDGDATLNPFNRRRKKTSNKDGSAKQ